MIERTAEPDTDWYLCVESLINRMNELVDILGPRNNDLNNMDTKKSCINTFLAWIHISIWFLVSF
jgi:hypothetical protein